MSLIKIIILATIGALIGWITNKIAIKLLFRPLYPKTIPLLNYKIQGLIPKRKDEIAKVIGETVEQELLSLDEIFEKFLDDDQIDNIKTVLRDKIKGVVKDKLPSIVPSAFKSMIISYIDEFIDSNGENFIKELGSNLMDKAKSSISISELVEDKINSYDMLKLENIVIAIANKELKSIEILGGILGFMIGLLQGILIIFIQ